eukprot:12405_1
MCVWSCCCTAGCARKCFCRHCTVATDDEASMAHLKVIKPTLVALVLTSIFCACVVGVSIFGFTVPVIAVKTTDKLVALNQNLVDNLNQLVGAVDGFVVVTDTAINETNALIVTAQATPIPDPDDYNVASFVAELVTMLDGVGEQLGVISTLTTDIRDMAQNLLWDPKQAEADMYYYTTFYVEMLVNFIAIGFGCALLLICRMFCKRRDKDGSYKCLPSCCMSITVVAMSLAYVGFIAEFMTLWILSDLCVDPDKIVIEIVEASGSEMLLEQVEFYIGCGQNPDLPDPMSDYYDTAVNLTAFGISELTDYIAANEAFIPEDMIGGITELKDSLVTMHNLLSDVFFLKECNPTNANYELLLSAICYDFTNVSGEVMLAIALQILFLLAATMSGCVTQYPEGIDKRTMEEVSQNLTIAGEDIADIP